MKKLVFFAIWLMGFNVGNGGIAYDLARDSDLPGRMRWKACGCYGEFLLFKLRDIHTEAYLIRYHWRQDFDKGYHCAVLFKDEGHWYITDNMSWKPVWVDDLPDLTRMLQEFQPDAEIHIDRVTQ